ncbi:MAG: hypothetical protein PHP37_00445 [Patescibacteria group bacterium]|nr:hypothetical protein [Patescibacteria group bacterium]
MKFKNVLVFSLTLLFFVFLLNLNPVLADTVKLSNPLGNNTTVPGLIGRVIDSVLGVVGSLALIMFIYGGITWMTAAGNEQSVTKGRNILMWSALGLVVIFSSYALVKFVIQAIGA